ncbi:hypothetical protein VQ03_26880 [Methylobacterium tarhaniae]|uniref:Uncharacterized protein n=1 Tax=Methylobacterium tarhaniae TaxID=1187852 RepID=A0A0J6SD65_9HYPH|nr:hypothetical protein VQ03_26880 [Methylobacterium tarhaniae]
MRTARPCSRDFARSKLFSPTGRLAGEVRLVGLFTATAYASPVRDVPVVRRKIAAVASRAGLDQDRIHTADEAIGLAEQRPLQRSLLPDPSRDEVVQPVVGNPIGPGAAIGWTLLRSPRGCPLEWCS